MDKHESLIRVQGIIFCVIALLIAVLSVAFQTLNPSTIALIGSITILLLGVPHGSFDAFYAQELFKLKGVLKWALFVVCYLMIAGFVILMWMLVPSFFFALFLFFSALHFSEDLPAEDTPFIRIMYGASIILLPSLFYSKEVTDYFTLITTQESAEAFGLFLLPLSRICIVGAVISIVHSFVGSFYKPSPRRFLGPAILLCNVILFLTVKPLVAFTVYFCAMHSPRHILRTFALHSKVPREVLIQSAVLPTIAVLLMFFVVVWRIDFRFVEKTWVSSLFVGIAALTAPHMILLKQRIRTNGKI